MAVDPNALSDVKQLRQLMKNAHERDREDLVLACQLRIAKLKGLEFSDVLEREFWQAVACAEEFKTIENGKTTRLSRTRQKYERVGAKQCLADWANDPKLTDGFRILIRAGHPEYTGEAVVVRHADLFDSATVEAAKAKLLANGANIGMFS
ncbi:MAG: hypothetical protein KKH72_03120 [Alphaproteobacteria bacterium]|nr:hypothetical protein [Alphaproteobacteria bacterium]